MIRSKLKRTLAAGVVSAALVLGGIFATAAPASAMADWEMHQVCKNNHGAMWTAFLMYPSQGAYGWRCIVANTPTSKSLDIAKYCRDWGFGSGARTNNPSDPNSWYCA